MKYQEEAPGSTSRQTIRFEAPFNKEFHIAGTRLRWELWSKAAKKQLYMWLIGIGVFLVLVMAEQEDDSRQKVFAVLGIACGFQVLLQWSQFRSQKDGFFKAVEADADRLLAKKAVIGYTMNEERLTYSDPERYFGIQWSVLKAYSLHKDHLIIWQNDSPLATYLFVAGQEGLDEATFRELLQLVQRQLPYKTAAKERAPKDRPDLIDR